VAAIDVSWRVTRLALPLSKLYVNTQDLPSEGCRCEAARSGPYARCPQPGLGATLVRRGDDRIACLKIAPAYVLHMPASSSSSIS